MRLLLTVLACVAVGGCVSKARQQQQAAEVNAKDEAYCRSIGAKPGSESYTNCRLILRREAAQKEAADGLAAQQTGNAMSAVGAALLAPQPQTYQRPLNCTSRTMYGTTTTQCF